MKRIAFIITIIITSNITNDDYVYFTQSHLEEVPSSELGWELNVVLSREGYISVKDWMPQISVNHVAMLAQRRGKIKDTGRISDGK